MGDAAERRRSFTYSHSETPGFVPQPFPIGCWAYAEGEMNRPFRARKDFGHVSQGVAHFSLALGWYEGRRWRPVFRRFTEKIPLCLSRETLERTWLNESDTFARAGGKGRASSGRRPDSYQPRANGATPWVERPLLFCCRPTACFIRFFRTRTPYNSNILCHNPSAKSFSISFLAPKTAAHGLILASALECMLTWQLFSVIANVRRIGWAALRTMSILLRAWRGQ